MSRIERASAREHGLEYGDQLFGRAVMQRNHLEYHLRQRETRTHDQRECRETCRRYGSNAHVLAGRSRAVEAPGCVAPYVIVLYSHSP